MEKGKVNTKLIYCGLILLCIVFIGALGIRYAPSLEKEKNKGNNSVVEDNVEVISFENPISNKELRKLNNKVVKMYGFLNPIKYNNYSTSTLQISPTYSADFIGNTYDLVNNIVVTTNGQLPSTTSIVEIKGVFTYDKMEVAGEVVNYYIKDVSVKDVSTDEIENISSSAKLYNELSSDNLFFLYNRVMTNIHLIKGVESKTNERIINACKESASDTVAIRRIIKEKGSSDSTGYLASLGELLTKVDEDLVFIKTDSDLAKVRQAFDTHNSELNKVYFKYLDSIKLFD